MKQSAPSCDHQSADPTSVEAQIRVLKERLASLDEQKKQVAKESVQQAKLKELKEAVRVEQARVADLEQKNQRRQLELSAPRITLSRSRSRSQRGQWHKWDGPPGATSSDNWTEWEATYGQSRSDHCSSSHETGVEPPVRWAACGTHGSTSCHDETRWKSGRWSRHSMYEWSRRSMSNEGSRAGQSGQRNRWLRY